jgi:carbon starvation protein
LQELQARLLAPKRLFELNICESPVITSYFSSQAGHYKGGYMLIQPGLSAAAVIFAALCVFAIGYRFYGVFLAQKALNLNNARQTPADKFADGHDYVKTNKFVLFGHHFAAIAAAGPLLGPVLAAQFGYMPGLLWILFGCVLAGGVHDMVVLFCSVRHKGQSLAYIATQEIDKTTGIVTAWAVIAILILTLAGLSIAVVNAMHNSAWSTYTVAATVPIAIIMGLYMHFRRGGGVLAASIIGVVLLVVCLLTGPFVTAHPEYFGWLNIDKRPMSVLIPVYGFLASVLPVWLLLLPRDYLSTFLKVGTIFALALGILFVLPTFQMPAFTKFTAGGGPIVAGPVIPFIFITIACGALSGFHATIGTGTTPKMIACERDVLFVGYGAMLLEGFVAVMALIAACVLVPADYFAINAPAEAFNALGMQVQELPRLSAEVQENIMHRPGGSVSLAVGMAHIFSKIPFMEGMMAYWYHFAIMFEAVFIMSAVDAGTRVGRFFLQEMIGKVWPRWGNKNWWPSILVTSVLFTGSWGYLVYSGDISSIWPLFGISNQLLASVTLLIGTTVLLRMNKTRYALLTGIPGVFMTIITFWAGIWMVVNKYLPEEKYLLVFLSILVMVMMLFVIFGTVRRWLVLLGKDTIFKDGFGDIFKEIVPE